MTTTEPTATYGVTRRTRKPITRAATELSQAINALAKHHRDETLAVPTSAGDLARARNAEASPEPEKWADDAARLEEIAADLRNRRDQLLERLELLRDPLIDLAREAHALLPEEALSSFSVEPYPHEPAPRPIAGIESELTLVEWVRILSVNVQWTRKWTEIWAVEAFGPCYMLSITIEHPTAEATELRKWLEDARDALKRFIYREYT
jgi:hypothetical protein